MSIQYGTNENETRIVELDGDDFQLLDDGEILHVKTKQEFEKWESGEYIACRFNRVIYMKFDLSRLGRAGDLETYTLAELNENLRY